MAEYPLSEQQIKLILEKHLINQVKIIVDQATLIDNNSSWNVEFQGLQSESFTISKDGDIF